MTLLDLLERLDELDEEDTIYAGEPWTGSSQAVSAREPDEGGLPAEAEERGLAYFLEVSIARETLEDWAAAQPEPPTAEARCERLIRYATDDA